MAMTVEMLGRAWQAYRERRHEEAIALCRLVFESDPDSADAWYLLGLCGVAPEDLQDARRAFLGAWRSQPEKRNLAEAACLSIRVEISPGELIDKITILEIKAERITDRAKLENVRTELAVLRQARAWGIPESPRLEALASELRIVNESLWDVEDEIRQCERQGDFGNRFVALARSVYRENDRRAGLKRTINDLLGARLIEEKSYGDARTDADSERAGSTGGAGSPPAPSNHSEPNGSERA